MSARFEIFETLIAGLKVLQRSPMGDMRGYLERMFCANELASLSSRPGNIVQINHTLTAKQGTIRGLHFQHPPHAEEKFVSCLQGEVFDVAVDLRRGSPTFLSWHAEVLSAGNHRTMFIPEGFAHGFQTLTPDCGMLYFHTALYEPAAEGGLNAHDPALEIRWPLEVTERSSRDMAHPLIAAGFGGLAV
jgi:dTDP-4-dehydrorhamnose 3,5-epimerase